MKNRLQSYGLTIKEDSFTASTPKGKVAMQNLIGIHASPHNRILMLACHLETKLMPASMKFVGANDAAAACALVVELIPHLIGRGSQHTYWFVFFDGEEAFESWSATDGLYGSRHLAAELKQSGLHASVRAMVLLDMIGDKELDVARDSNSDPELIAAVTEIARRKGWSRHFFQYSVNILDDHIPFRRLHIPAIDLIDFRYGRPTPTGAGSFFHSSKDTIDKISPKSLQIVGEVTLELLKQLDQERMSQ